MNYTNPAKIFILGNPRSGTSLLRIMLNAHSEIMAAPESGFMQWWYEKYKNWSNVDLINEQTVMEVVRDILSSKKIETWNIDAVDLRNMINEYKPDNYGELCILPYLLRAKSQSKNAKLIVDKNNYYIHHLNTIEKIWPDAKYIFLIRDGRDVACSYLAMKKLLSQSKYQPDLPVSINEIAEEWSGNNTMISEFLENKHTNNYLCLRYEDLISAPENTIKIIVEFLNIPFDSKMLEYYKYNDEPSSTMDWKKNTLKNVMPDNVGKYKDLLTKTDINVFNEIAEKMLVKFDYELT